MARRGGRWRHVRWNQISLGGASAIRTVVLQGGGLRAVESSPVYQWKSLQLHRMAGQGDREREGEGRKPVVVRRFLSLGPGSELGGIWNCCIGAKVFCCVHSEIITPLVERERIE